MSEGSISMSITRALVELKTLEKRITKKTEQSVFVTAQVNQQNIDDKKVENATADYQSLRDIMKYYNTIKSAIVLSNAVTEVTISGKSYKVCEAIDRKYSIVHEKNLLTSLKKQRNAVNQRIETHRRQTEQRLDRQVEVLYSSTGKNKTDGATEFHAKFLHDNRVEMIDPLNIDKKIESIELEIEEFEKEVDFVLSESNSLTKITV